MMGPRGAGLIRGIDAARAARHRMTSGGTIALPAAVPIIKRKNDMIQQATVSNNVNLDIDKNDILAIAVSRAEAGLIAKVESLTTQAKDLDKIITLLTQELEAKATYNIPTEFKAHTSNAILSLKAYGISTVAAKNEVSRYCKTLIASLTQQGNYGRNEIARKEFTFDELGVSELNDSITKKEEESKALKTEALETRKKLSNISTLERAVRGRLAEARLREMDGGESVIQAVLADLDLNVKSLPGF